MKSFKELRENSFYTTQAEKSKFETNDKLVINAFMFSFVGMVGLLDGAKDNTRVKAYFRSDQKLRPTEIGDDNQDSSLIVKIMMDQGFFKKSTTPNEITRFLVKAKGGQIDTVDPEIIRGWIRDIKDDKMKGLSAVVRREVKAFLDGGSLATLTDQLKANAKVTRWKESEFGATSKAVKIDPAKKKAAPAVTKPTTTSNDLDLDAADADTTPPLVSPDRLAKVPAPATKGAKVQATIDDLFKAVRDGVDPTTLYKKPTSDLNTSVAVRFYNEIPSLTVDEGKRFVEYLQNNSFKVNGLKETVFKRSYYRSSSVTSDRDRLSKGLLMGINKLFGKLSKSQQYNLAVAAARVFDDWITKSPADWTRDGSDPQMIEIANLTAGATHHLGRWNLVYSTYIRKGKEEALSLIVNRNIAGGQQVRKIGDSYFYNIDPNAMQYGISATLTPEYVKFLEFLGAKREAGVTKLIKSYLSNGLFSKDVNDLGPEDQKIFVDSVLKTLEGLPGRSNIALKDVFSRSGSAVHDWQIQMLVKAVDLIEISPLLGPPSFVTPTVDISNMGKYPIEVAKKIEERILEFSKSPKFKPSYYVKTIQFAEDRNLKVLMDSIVNRYHREVLDVIRTSTNRPTYGNYRNPLYRDPSLSGTGYKITKIMNEKYRSLQDDIDTKWIQKSVEVNRPISAPANMFSDMSDANKRRVLSYITVRDDIERSMMYTVFNRIGDDEYYKKINVRDWSSAGRKIGDLARNHSSGERKDFYNKVIKNPETKERIKEEALSAGYYEKSRIIADLTESDLDEKEFAQLVDKSLDGSTQRTTEVVVGNYTESVNKKDSLNKKDRILFEKSVLWADQNIKKLRKEYQNLMTSAQPTFIAYSQSDRKGAEALYESMSKSMKKRMAAAYLSNGEFALTAGGELVSDSNPIKPFQVLNDKRIREILKYNNVVSEETKISDKHIKTLDTLDNYIKTENPEQKKKLENLKVDEVKKSPKELSQMSADLHRSKRNNRHGDVSMVIKKEFNVAIPLQVKSQAEWIEKDPNQEIINPMYHGTGSIAASMILRYGFRVIKSGDSSVVGRMLGDGVYGAIHIDKSQQYVGDEGYARTPGLRGYIFEINAALGKEGKDYRAAGLGNRDGIRSPEWCVFTPNSQFKIFKAYEVELVRGSTMAKILDENPPMKNESKSIGFKEFLKETTVMEEYPNYTTYTFVNGLIPISESEYVDFEEFKPTKKGVTLEPSAYGPSVVIEGTDESNDYLFTGPTDLSFNHPELFQEYLDQITN